MRRIPFASTRSRVLLILLVTLVEGAGLYAWLRLYDDVTSTWAWVALVAGEILETTIVAVPLARARSQIPVGDPYGAVAHRRRFERRFLAASVAELLIWLAWLQIALNVGQPLAAAVLLVLMHLKHQLEASTVRDTRYLAGFWRPGIASLSESAGAVGCLALIREGEPLLAAGALAAGLLLEHTLLILQLCSQLEDRDISVPLPRRPPLTLRLRFLERLGKSMRPLWKLLQGIGPVESVLNRLAIDQLVKQVEPRPNPLSTKAAYSSWDSLTDRTYSGRHLGPSAAGARGFPPVEDVAALFRRKGEMVPCPKSTMLFASFAQWFVDGFLRTERDKPGHPRDTLRNESNHDIDLSQLYGFTPEITDALRLKEGGRMRSTLIDGEEYPERLCCCGLRKFRFRPLPAPQGFRDPDLKREDKDRLFAMGTDVHSIGFTAINVLFLREHNRIARQLELRNADWNDERLFGTARAILIVILLKIVVGEYINHITGFWFQFRFPPPGTFRTAPWLRQNWMTLEFDLLYRWHPLMPGTLRVGNRHLTVPEMLLANDLLTSGGLRAFMLAAAEQRAGRIGLFNTDPFLVANAEIPSIQQGRVAELRSYNDYRELSHLPRLSSFSEFSTDGSVGKRLHALYDRVDDVELYVGLFAEQASRYDMLPPLMTAMVAFDAFSQALTNPLLAPRVYGPQTFSEAGMAIIDETENLESVIRRNVPYSEPEDRFSLTWSGYRGA